MVPAVVCILLKINCDAFWCFLRLLYIFDGSLNQMGVLHLYF